MAPVDRQQHRKERMRGAGYGAGSNAPKLGFNFSIPQKTVKQASLPPQRSSRRSRTPGVSTPRGATGSAQRTRSASGTRSSSKARNIPEQATPQLGKRKRGSKHAQSGDEDDGELDPLSPDNHQEGRSVEKSRKVTGPVSPIREELVEADELSIMGDDNPSARKVGNDGLKGPLKTQRDIRMVERTPVTNKNDEPISASRQERISSSKSSKSLDLAPSTPAMIARRNIARRASSILSIRGAAAPDVIQEAAESEDELSTPLPNSATPRPVSRAQSSPSLLEEEQERGIDELSPPAQISETQPEVTYNAKLIKKPLSSGVQPLDQQPTPKPENRRTSRPAVEEEEDLVHSTPTGTKPRRISNRNADVEELGTDYGHDELSPEGERTRLNHVKPTLHNQKSINISPNGISSDNRRVDEKDEEDEESEESEESEGATRRSIKRLRGGIKAIDTSVDMVSSELDSESEQDEDPPDPKPRPTEMPIRTQAHSSPKYLQRTQVRGEKPPRKRQKHSGVTQSIQVMRLKGSKINGYTVADTTRTAMEEYIDERVSLLSTRFQGTQDLARRKQIKSRINLQLSFKEALSERMLDLQDVNDSFTDRAHKLKSFKRHNAELRKEILATQNSRQELALEYDNVLAEFEMEKEAYETKNKLSTSMFDMQAAIKRGREAAEELDKGYDGPAIPLSMLLENVARDVGSLDGGLLKKISGFNGALERVAGFLESRA